MKKVKRELKKQNDATDTIIEETRIDKINLRLVYRTIFWLDQRGFVGNNNT